MGSCLSTAEDSDARKRHADVEGEMKKVKRQMQREAKILLLGSGDSGKTTIMKQMRLLTDGAFTRAEIESYRQLVFSNLVMGIKAIAECLAEIGISLDDDPDALNAFTMIEQAPDIRRGQPFPEDYLQYFVLLWQHGTIRDGMDRCRQFAIPDNVPYFFSDLPRLWAPDYSPTNLDIVQTRARTAGIVETIFHVSDSFSKTSIPHPSARASILAERRPTTTGSLSKSSSPRTPSVAPVGSQCASDEITVVENEEDKKSGALKGLVTAASSSTRNLRFVDVGGQKSERRKWIHCFADVTAIMYLVPLSGYDQCLVEDRSTNQMQDAMSIWEWISTLSYFRKTSLILFLNKVDLFEGKVAASPIRRFFPDYDGASDDVTAGKEYFKKRFLRIEHKGTSQLRQQAKDEGRQSQSTYDQGPFRPRQVYPHFTTAVDTSLIFNVMIAVNDTIVREHLRNSNLL